MRRQQWGQYAVALAILVVGLAWAGVPVSSLLIAGLVLVCPLMMLVMMRGMHDGDTSAATGTRRVPTTPTGGMVYSPPSPRAPGATELQQVQEQLRRSRCTGETAWTAGASS
jgi:hypothetical protein